MQNTEKIYTNPNLCVGLWVESAHYPSAGAGQVQRLHPRQNACLIERWQRPVVNSLSLNGVYHPNHTLHPAQYLYIGHYLNTVYYVHHTRAYRLEFEPIGELATVHDLDETQTHFYTRRAYLEAHHQDTELTLDDHYLILDTWFDTGALGGIIPYLADNWQALVGSQALVVESLPLVA